MSEPTNEERANRAGDFIDAYAVEVCECWPSDNNDEKQRELARTLMADMVADMMHLCDSIGIPWEPIATLAEIHHNCEVDKVDA